VDFLGTIIIPAEDGGNVEVEVIITEESFVASHGRTGASTSDVGNLSSYTQDNFSVSCTQSNVVFGHSVHNWVESSVGSDASAEIPIVPNFSKFLRNVDYPNNNDDHSYSDLHVAAAIPQCSGAF